MSYIYPVTGNGANPATNQYDALTIATDTTLQWPFSFTDSALITAQIMHVTASSGGLSLLLPDASQASVGQSIIIKNQGANAFTVKSNTGVTILSAAAGISYFIYITDNSTVSGVWQTLTFGAGSNATSAASLAGNGLEASASLLQIDTPGSYKNSNFTLGTNDRGSAIIWTGGVGAITVPSAASLGGSGYIVFFSNRGTGNAVFTTSGGELINGAASFTFAAGNSGVIICGAQTGNEFVVVGFGQAVTFAFTQLIKDVSGSSNVTLTSSEQANKLIKLIGTITANINIIVATTPDFFVITNSTSGSFSITVKTAAGTGVVASPGLSRTMICDGTNVLYANDVGSGTVTSVATGTGLTGGPITGSGTVSLANTTVAAGSYGDATNIATFTVDAQGRLSAATSVARSTVFSDSVFRVQDNADATKQVAFEASGITTGTTRTVTIPDANTTMVGTDVSQTLTNKTLTSPTANNLTVTGTAVPANGMYLPSSNTVGLSVNSVYRVRTDLTGFCYSGSNPGAVPSSSNSGTMIADTNATSPNLSSCGATVTAVPQWQFINGNGTVGSITTNASATAFNTSSDEKLKDNVEPIKNSGEIIDTLEAVKFTWKTAEANIGYGVLAQQAYKVFPDAVTKGNDKEPDEDGFQGWSVDYSKFVPIMLAELKALREREAESRAREASYVARLEALEGSHG